MKQSQDGFSMDDGKEAVPEMILRGSGAGPAHGEWRRFFKHQFVVWLGLAAVFFWIETHQEYPKQWLQDSLKTIFWAGSGALMTSMLCLVYDRIKLTERGRYWIALAVAFGSLLAALLWFASYNWLNGRFGIPGASSPISNLSAKEIFHNLYPRTGMVVLWHLVGLVRIQSSLTRAERERAHRLEKLSLEAQIRQLRSSLNPHFLFNSLNSAISLVDESPETAKEMMLSLSALLRETLSSSSKERVTVAEELDLIGKYIAIERIRYEEDLLYFEKAQPTAGPVSLPPFLLLPLVQNAVKHGMRTAKLPLEIVVEANLENRELRVRVKNTGSLGGLEGDQGESGDPGTGVITMRERLAVELPGRAEFDLVQEGEWVVATLVVRSADGGKDG